MQYSQHHKMWKWHTWQFIPHIYIAVLTFNLNFQSYKYRRKPLDQYVSATHSSVDKLAISVD